jgi:hypothetical protein
MKKFIMFLFIVITFFGIVGCPSSDSPATKAATSSVVTESQIGGDTSDGDGAFAVPEPVTLLLLGSGLVGLAVVGRKNFKE